MTITVLSFLDQHVFAGVPSNAVWDLIKLAWKKATARNWEELYLDAFEQALADEKPILERYGDAEVVCDRTTLERILHQNLDTAISELSLSELTAPSFVHTLAMMFAERDVLTIGGNNLSSDSYRQLVANFVRHATAKFKSIVATDQAAFQRAIIDQSLHNVSLLADTKRYLTEQFGLVLLNLELISEIKQDTEAIRDKLEIITTGIKPDLSRVRAERLIDMSRLSRARSIDRWQAAGLSRDMAIQFADDPSVGVPIPEYRPNADRPLLVLVADLGAGKSLIGERLYQAAIELARSIPDAPVPIFLEAEECAGKLRQTVKEQAAGIGDVRYLGASVVIDGADEMGIGAEGLLRECRILVNLWPNTTVVITSRPMSAFASDQCQNERVDVRPLSQEEAIALIQRLTGIQQLNLFGWPASIRDAVRRPLFAILLSIHLQNIQGLTPQSTGELLTYLVERALGHKAVNVALANTLLRRLAVLSTDQAGRFIATSELAPREHIQPLLDSRLVVERHGAIGFPLAILREWFAAQSLSSGSPSPDDLVSDRSHLELWRYPLLMFVSTFGLPQVIIFLEKLVHQFPGYASEIISDAVPAWDAGQSEDRDLYTLGEWAAWIRIAMQAWIEGIGPLADCIAPVIKNGRQCPLGISGHGGALTMSWYRGPDNLPDIVIPWIPNRTSRPFDWSTMTMTHPVQNPTWAWRWTRDYLRDSLRKRLDGRSLPLPDGPSVAELFWRISRELVGRGTMRHDPIPLQEIDGKLQHIRENTTLVLRGNTTLNPPTIAWYRQQLAHRRSTGATEIQDPWPGPDSHNPTDRWIWSNYSDEQLLNRTVKVISAAIEIYRQLVSAWFPTFENELATAVLFPARFIGVLTPPSREATEYPVGFTLHWHWHPLSRHEQGVVNVELGTHTRDSIQEINFVMDSIKRLRPQSASWLPASVYGQVADYIFETMPATRLAYQWLMADLKRISWVN